MNNTRQLAGGTHAAGIRHTGYYFFALDVAVAALFAIYLALTDDHHVPAKKLEYASGRKSL